MKIGVDIDEILAEFVKGYLELYNKKYGKNIKFEDVFTYSLCEPLKISKQESIKLADEYYGSDDFDNIKLVQGAKEGIKKLNEQHKLIFVTARPNHTKEKTELFLKKILPDVDLDISHSNNLWSKGLLKSEVCINKKCDLLIEDTSSNALDCADKGIKIILLDKPWNQGVEHENIIRVYNWGEILGEINKLNSVKEKENEK